MDDRRSVSVEWGHPDIETRFLIALGDLIEAAFLAGCETHEIMAVLDYHVGRVRRRGEGED